MEKLPIDTLLKHGLEFINQIIKPGVESSEFIEVLIELLEPYFVKTEKFEHLQSQVEKEVSGNTLSSQQKISINHSDELSMRFNTLNHRIDELNYEIDDFRGKVSTK